MQRQTPPYRSPRTIVFDSGVGGLSILEEVRRAIPDGDFVFACDNAAFPYGILSETQLIERVCRVMERLVTELEPDIVIIACNTASTVALEELRRKFDTTFVGVVPAIKPAAAISDSKVIGLLATPGTIERSYTDSLISDFAPNCKVLRIGSSELVQIAEKKMRGIPPDTKTIERILEPFRAEPSIDSIVLACTHFPLIADELKSTMPKHVQWVDSGAAIARRTLSIIDSNAFAARKIRSKKQDSFRSPSARLQLHRAFMTAQSSDMQSLITGNPTYGLSDFELLKL